MFSIITVLIAVLIAIALGIGLTLGLKHSEPLAGSPIPSPNATAAPIIRNGILNDTSIAAITTQDGNRHIFFQDFNGSLRHTSFDQSANSWLPVSQYIQTDAVPRKFTPLAVVEIDQANYFSDTGPIMSIFLTTMNNSLANVKYAMPGLTEGTDMMNGSFLLAPNSRTLSVTQTVNNANLSVAANPEIILAYEDLSHNITTFYGNYTYIYHPDDGAFEEWIWQNVSQPVGSAIASRSDTWRGSPIAISVMSENTDEQNPNITSTHVCFAYFNPDALVNQSAAPVYLATFDDWSSSSESTTPLCICRFLHFRVNIRLFHGITKELTEPSSES